MRENKTYPLSFLFVLVTISAVIVGVLGNIVPAMKNSSAGPNDLLTTLMVGGAGGAILGLIMGCYRIDRRSGIFVCSLTGAFVGGLATCLYHVDFETYPKLLASQIGGAVLILFLAAIFRFGIRSET